MRTALWRALHMEVDAPPHVFEDEVGLKLAAPDDGWRDFEAGGAWWERLAASGFDATRPAVVASAGVSMYLTRDAIAATLRQVAALAPRSTLVMSFMPVNSEEMLVATT